MKKMIFLAVATSLLAMAPAQAKNLYVQADLGLSNLNYTPDGSKIKLGRSLPRLKDSYKESGVMPRVSAGYDMGNYRVAVDYTHHKNVKDTTTFRDGALTEKYDIEVKAKSLGVSGIYDFNTGGKFEPYVGLRLGYNKVQANVNVALSDGKETVSDGGHEKDTKFGLGAMAGVNYKINDALTADVGYRYNRIYADLKAHEVSAGIRYSF